MKRKHIYSGKIIGLDVYEMTVRRRPITREIISHPGAAAILAFDGRGRLIMVRQHRFGHGFVLEIPAGTLEKGEKPEECAMRELCEETGYGARKMRHLVTYYPSIGYNTEAIHCYVASGTKRVSETSLDPDEILTVEFLPLRRVMKMIRDGQIQDSKTITAVMTYAVRKKLC